MTTRPYRRIQGSRGVSALLFAVLLTAMLGVSALAVDVGAAYTERRHDQNTADVAVMSGAVEAVLGGGIIDDVVDEVRQKVNVTLGKTVTPAEWLACEDDEQLDHTARELAAANEVISPVTDCISFSRTFEEVRVKLPRQKAIGVFGPSLGFGDIHVTAGANAQIESATGGLPFVALATATKGDFVCLRTSSAKEPLPLANGGGPGVPASYPTENPSDPTVRADPCHSEEFDTESENFGTLLPYRYEDCSQQNVEVEQAISIGLDHPMGIFPHGYYATPPVPSTDPTYDEYRERIDGAPFTGPVAGCQTAYPNTFELDSGLNASGLNCALMGNGDDTTCNGVPARLRVGDYVQETGGALLGRVDFDNSAPWDFLRDSASLEADGSPPECVSVAANRDNPDWDQYDRYDALITCLKKWGQWIPDGNEGDGNDFYWPENELFTAEIGLSGRFGFVPQVAEESLADVDEVHIEGFLPIFMYRLYIQEPGSMCDPLDPRNGSGLKVHDAGVPWNCAASNGTVDRLASIIFACGMVPDALCNKSTGEPQYAGKDIYEFRLVK
ncbi:MAG: pilus assembly protein TadG-related protein [Acidimicrobiia bacterium]